MGSLWKPVVAIPARDEQDRLPSLVRALGEQDWLPVTGGTLDLVVVLNNCRDRSRQALEEACSAHPGLKLRLIEVDFAPPHDHVGSARRLAMDAALEASCGPTVVLTTDADAAPLPNWVRANLEAVAAGADLVGGRLIGDKAEEAVLGPGFQRRAALQARYASACDKLASLIDPLPHDPWPRHHDHTGGSLAIRGDVYRALGGLPALRCREDLALVSAVRRSGYCLRHAPDVEVEVSARLAGRAPGGMADCLKTWLRDETEGKPVLVEAPERVRDRLTKRRMLRDLCALPPAGQRMVAESLGIAWAQLLDPTGLLLPPHTLAETFAADDPDTPSDTPVGEALARIEMLVRDYEDQCVAA